MDLKDRFNIAITRAGVSQTDVARAAHVKPQTIQAIAAGKTKNPRRIGGIAKFLGVSPEWLLFGVENDGQDEADKANILPAKVKIYKIPLLELSQVEDWLKGSLSITPRSVNMYSTDEIEVKNLIAINVQGDAMESASNIKGSICDSDTVIFDTSLEAKTNDVVLVKIDEAYKIRQYTRDGSEEILTAFNSKYPAHIVNDTTKILGVKFKVLRD